MSRTIVQSFGPIYGEPVNGTVMGRPNGSVYVPLSNKITLKVDTGYNYAKYESATQLSVCNSAGAFGGYYRCNAEAQDLASYMRQVIYSDAELTTIVSDRYNAAGHFSSTARRMPNPIEGLEDGQTLYFIAYLMNNSVPIATSDVIELTMVVPE